MKVSDVLFAIIMELQICSVIIEVKLLQTTVDRTCRIEEIQETPRITEKKIFDKESELQKLSVEMREKCDEITHLKTREMSLIDKSDTLEKGQIMNIIYYM